MDSSAKIVELSFPIDVSMKKFSGDTARNVFNFKRKEVPLKSENIKYTGIIYDIFLDSMAGTYIDLPGHISETDDGNDLASCSPGMLYRLKTCAIPLENPDGGVGVQELAAGCGGNLDGADALIINAFGKNYIEEHKARKTFLTKDAAKWIIENGIKLLVSDIYESPALDGIFYDLFSAGIATVCNPMNLHLVGDRCILSVFTLALKGITQSPCRVIAEINGEKES